MKRILIFAKLGFKSVGRLGVISFLCLTLSFTLLIFATRDFSQIADEKKQPCTVIAQSINISQDQSASAKDIDGVLTSTAVIAFPTQLVVGDYTRELTVYAVEPEWIDNISQGEIFPESSTMPYIVLSEKALEGFKDKTGKTVFSDSIDWQNSEVSLNGFYGNVCGITSDEDTAVGYISHAAAESMLLFSSDIPVYTQLWLKLENSGYEESVISELTAMGLIATSDSTKWQDWKYDTRNALIICFSGAAILFAAIAIIGEKTKQDMLKNRSEYVFLQYMGTNHNELIVLHIFRILLFVILSLIVSLILCTTIPYFSPLSHAHNK